MIDVQRDELLRAEDAARILRVSTRTILAWMAVGFCGRRLESIRIGRRLYTSHRALQAFGVRANEPLVLTAGFDNGEHEAALRELSALGVNV